MVFASKNACFKCGAPKPMVTNFARDDRRDRDDRYDRRDRDDRGDRRDRDDRYDRRREAREEVRRRRRGEGRRFDDIPAALRGNAMGPKSVRTTTERPAPADFAVRQPAGRFQYMGARARQGPSSTWEAE